MKIKSMLAILIISTTGLFNFFNQSEKENTETSSTIIGMVLLEDVNSLDIVNVIADLENKWNLKIKSEETDEDVSVIVIGDYNIGIVNIASPIPGDEVKETAEYSYLWENGVTEATKHKGHVIVTIMNGGKNLIKENILFNQIAAAVLENSKSLGIYMGGRTLLLKKDFYLENTKGMSSEQLPLHNWIYFGLREGKAKRSMYTFGLADFGKKEMEVVNSKKDIDEINEMMYNITHYVLASDVTLRDGETIGMSATQKIKIKESKGEFLAGKTLKIKF